MAEAPKAVRLKVVEATCCLRPPTRCKLQSPALQAVELCHSEQVSGGKLQLSVPTAKQEVSSVGPGSQAQPTERLVPERVFAISGKWFQPQQLAVQTSIQLPVAFCVFLHKESSFKYNPSIIFYNHYFKICSVFLHFVCQSKLATMAAIHPVSWPP